MKKTIRFALAAFAGLVLAACSDDADNYKVYLDRTEVETGASAGTFTVRVSSNFPWKAEVADALFDGWCTLSGAEGDAGVGEFTIEVGENETGAARMAQVVVTAGDDRAVVSVVQEAPAGTRLDRVMRSDYLGDEFVNGLGYMSFELRSDGFMEARYEGNIDGYGTAKLVFDVRDPFRGDGMNIAVYVPLHPEFDYPGGASLTLGAYSFGTAGDPMTLEAGYVENGLPYGSYTYQIDGGMKYIIRMIVGGSLTVGRYDTEEYDIRFDLMGEDGTGTPPAGIGKYRYIGPITFADKRSETYTVNPVNVVAASYAGVSPDGKTGRYTVRFGTSDTEWDRSSQHLVLTFYGDIPASGAAPRLKPGTYACSRETYEALTFEQGNVRVFNPAGTYYMDVDASGLRTAYLVDKGRFTVSETAAGYRFDMDLGAHPNGDTGRVIIRLSWEGELSLE